MENEAFYIVRHKGLFVPAPLSKGDKIGIISLSGYDAEEVMGAMSVIASNGFVPVLSDAIQNSLSESGLIPRGDRIIGVYSMLEDPEIKAIFCCGDGSGSVELLPNFSYGPIAKNPKWLVGKEAVTAFLSMWAISDIAAIYGPMCSDLTAEGPGAKALFNLLTSGGSFDYTLPSSPENGTGKISGRIIGGNLSMITLLNGTSYDLLTRNSNNNLGDKGVILFLEDSNVSFRKVRDMLLRFYLTGDLQLVKGLIFGSFRNCKSYEHLHSIKDVVKELEERWMIPPGIPIVYDFPIGEGTENLPLTEGIEAELEVTADLVTLRSLRN